MRNFPSGVLACLALALALVLTGCRQPTGSAPSGAENLSADADTVGLWHFNEGSGQTASDSSGEGWDLTLGSDATAESVDPVWTADGRFGNGLAFTADETDYVSGPGQTVFSTTQQLSVEFWIRTSNTATSHPVTSSGLFFYSQLNGDGILQAEVGDGSNWKGSVNTSTAINDGQWHYIAIVYDGTLNGGTISMYVDGTLENDRSSLTGSTLLNPSAWYIGGRPFNTFVDGVMDEVRVSKSARSATEIAANF